MAAIAKTVSSAQLTQLDDPGSKPLKPSEYSGRVRLAYFYYFPTVAVAAASVIGLCNLPPNARIIGGTVKSNAFVATSTMDIGLIAADGSGVIDAAGTADSATLFTGGGTLAVANAGEYPFANTIANNYGYVVTYPSQLVAKLNTAGMDGVADILQGHVLYVVD